jgi:hypothetical protein
MKRLIPFLFMVLLLIVACKSQETKQKAENDLTMAKDETESVLKSTLTECYNRAEACNEGIPAVEDELRKECYEVYYYTGEINELKELIKDMC